MRDVLSHEVGQIASTKISAHYRVLQKTAAFPLITGQWLARCSPCLAALRLTPNAAAAAN
ncbi:hypothetical protein, partial [Plesiomonas shigelloides]|uniref:hypothetical protein n=1 Tax=Plesiomonas shigelloides TaxID=703 RepID=UPI001C497F3C